jgi:hypothetical protein
MFALIGVGTFASASTAELCSPISAAALALASAATSGIDVLATAYESNETKDASGFGSSTNWLYNESARIKLAAPLTDETGAEDIPTTTGLCFHS